jgi:hypothetical protein
MSSGAEPDVDRDLAMLTYEIAALVGMGGPTAFDAMAALASERMSSPSDPPRLAATPRIDLAGCSWTGSYAAVDGGPHRSMGLDVDVVDGWRSKAQDTGRMSQRASGAGSNPFPSHARIALSGRR